MLNLDDFFWLFHRSSNSWERRVRAGASPTGACPALGEELKGDPDARIPAGFGMHGTRGAGLRKP